MERDSVMGEQSDRGMTRQLYRDLEREKRERVCVCVLERKEAI